MSQLLESILNEDYVSANELFEERMLALQERKLYEAKRNIAAMYEAEGKYGHYMGKEDWAKYRKKHPSLGMYDTPAGKVKKPEDKVEKKRKAGYVKAYPALKALEFVKAVKKYHETGKIDEQETPFMRTLGKAAAAAVAAKPAKKRPAPGALGVGKTTPVKDAEAEKKEKVKKSWDEFQSGLASRLQRSSEMRKKRSEFLGTGKGAGQVVRRTAELAGAAAGKKIKSKVKDMVTGIPGRLADVAQSTWE